MIEYHRDMDFRFQVPIELFRACTALLDIQGKDCRDNLKYVEVSATGLLATDGIALVRVPRVTYFYGDEGKQLNVGDARFLIRYDKKSMSIPKSFHGEMVHFEVNSRRQCKMRHNGGRAGMVATTRCYDSGDIDVHYPDKQHLWDQHPARAPRLSCLNSAYLAALPTIFAKAPIQIEVDDKNTWFSPMPGIRQHNTYPWKEGTVMLMSEISLGNDDKPWLRPWVHAFSH